MFKEFKEFAMKGNVLDMAIGVIIGGAFGKIVSSFVADIMMPPLTLLMGRGDFSSLFIDLSGKGHPTLAAAKADGVATLNYGLFLNTTIDFMIVAFAVFLMVKQINRFVKKPEPAPAPATKECPYCFSAVAPKATRCPQCTSELRAA